jgi:hypothetical protein
MGKIRRPKSRRPKSRRPKSHRSSGKRRTFRKNCMKKCRRTCKQRGGTDTAPDPRSAGVGVVVPEAGVVRA